MKIQIVGYSGSGKSTLASYLAERKKLPLLFLDSVQFTQNWQERDFEEKEALVQSFMQQSAWIIDGNYQTLFFEERIAAADQIIIMTFSRLAALWRVFKRYLTYRGKTRPSMAEGNLEKLDWEFIWWVLYQGRTKERRQMFTDIQQAYPQKVVLIKNQRQLDAFYQNIS
ncbi:P-loop NTPase family protein [Enterococcus sp. LJL90]